MSADTTTNTFDLTGFQRDLLVAVRDRPGRGSDIKRELEAAQGRELNNGRVYPNLRRLVERGFVEKDTHAENDRSHRFELTPRGHSALTELREFMADG